MAQGETDQTLALLEGQVKALYQRLDALNATIDALRHELTLKDFEIARLKRMLFGQRRERFDTKTAWLPGLLPTAQNDAPSAQPAAPEKPAKERKPRKTARPRLDADPARVPERHVTQKPAQTRCGCCGGALVKIGEERNERIEFKPQVFERVITHRPKMACNQCKGGGVVVAPKDDPPITGAGPVGLSLAVDIAVQHYADHLPFHRIATRYARDGLTIDRATLSRVGGRVADALQLVVGAIESELLSSDAVMGIDGTGIKILAPGRCRRRAAYVLHGRGHVVYRMLQAEDANTVLEGFGAFRGVVISDAAKVHTGKVGAAMGLDVALCNAHARRYFFDARETDPAHAEYALSFYATVAHCEQQWSTLD
ncbi:MAG: transposase, partial [Deltaproteobacteria bacterium]|nr:transposase [Deltaproteobacteria bacterium]